MKVKIKNTISVAGFLFLIAVPQTLKASSHPVWITEKAQCLSEIRKNWFPKVSHSFHGDTRHQTKCHLKVDLTENVLSLRAEGPPLEVEFDFGNVPQVEQTLEACRVDREKVHLVFEEKALGQFEKKERIQLTLLKRHGKGVSMILAKREMKLFRPAQQSNLICHLN